MKSILSKDKLAINIQTINEKKVVEVIFDGRGMIFTSTSVDELVKAINEFLESAPVAPAVFKQEIAVEEKKEEPAKKATVKKEKPAEKKETVSTTMNAPVVKTLDAFAVAEKEQVVEEVKEEKKEEAVCEVADDTVIESEEAPVAENDDNW